MDDAIRFWISHGADGIFLDGLENFDVNVWVAQKISYWHGLLDRFTSSTGCAINYWMIFDREEHQHSQS